MDRFTDEVLPVTLVYEGGFSDRKDDPGGRTMQGVTQRVYDAYRKNIAKRPIRDVKLIDFHEVHEIYKTQYWNKVDGGNLPVGLDLAVFDFAVNSGPAQATKELQRLVHVTDDGIMGTRTLQAVQSNDDLRQLIEDYSEARLRFMRKLKNWATDQDGWTTRVNGVEDHAVKEYLASVDENHPKPAIPAGPTIPSDAQAHQMPKADPATTQMIKTKPGIVGVIASASVVAPAVATTTEALKPYTNHAGLLGQIALGAVIVLTLVGGVFAGYTLLKPYLKS